MKTKLYLIAAFIFSTQLAIAGPLLEPYGGYLLGDYSPTDTATYGGQTRGAFVGGRAGLGLLGIHLVGDGMFLTSGQLTGSPENYRMNLANVGGALMFDLPFIPRFWAGYGYHEMFIAKKDSTKYDSTRRFGSYFKLGVGFSLFPFVSLNIEYMNYIYDRIKFFGGTRDRQISPIISDNGDFRANHQAVLVSLSVPLGW